MVALRKKYLRLANNDFAKAWRLQKAAEKKQKAKRKKTTKKKGVTRKKTAKKTVKKTVKRKTAKKAVKRKVVKKRAVKKAVKKRVVKKVSNPKRKVSKVARKKSRKRSKGTTRRRKRPATIQQFLTNGVVGVGGAVGAGALANMIPVKQPALKAVVPAAIGIGLYQAKLVKGEMGKALAMGAVIASGIALTRQFVPQLPMIAGEDDELLDYVSPEDEQAAMLGMTPRGNEFSDLGIEDDNFADDEEGFMGVSEDIAGESISVAGDGWATPANM